MLALAFIKEKTMGKRRVILSRDIENLERQEINRAKIRFYSNNFGNREEPKKPLAPVIMIFFISN